MTKNKTQNWVFLSRTRKWAISISILLLILTIIQTSTGKYDDLIHLAWIIRLALTLPIIILLWINRKTNRFSGRILSKKTHFIFVSLTLIYFLSILVYFFSESFLLINLGWGGIQSMINSLILFLPFESILIVLYWLLFYKGKFQITPDSKLIKEFVENASKIPVRANGLFIGLKKECQDLVANNELLEVFQLMRKYFESNNKLKDKETIVLQRQFNEILQQRNIGLITYEEARVVNNRIAFAILEMLE